LPPPGSLPSTTPRIALAFGGRGRQIARHENRSRDLHYGFDYYPLTFVGGAVFFISTKYAEEPRRQRVTNVDRDSSWLPTCASTTR
jgi:hypothetical protein